MRSGFLLIDKPEGISSFDVIRQLRRITSIRKMGHAGTLDPFADGLILIAVGNATRLLKYFTEAHKTYKAEIEFGASSDTGDSTGMIRPEGITHPEFDPDVLKHYVLNLTSQIPSKYSAIKINGKKAYELARKNVEFSMKEKSITVFDFHIESKVFPQFTYVSKVSSGCYIRTLTEQLAEFLGTKAFTKHLTRMAIGELSIDMSVRLVDLTSENWESFLLPYSRILTDILPLVVNEFHQTRFLHGNSLYFSDEILTSGRRYFIMDNENRCLGVGLAVDNFIKAEIVFSHENEE